MDERRRNRLAESIREELAQLIRFEMSDPRAASIDVTRVDLAADLSHLVVFIAKPVDETSEKAALNAVRGARHFLRRSLANRLQMRRVPELQFAVDRDLEETDRLAVLFERARKWRRKAHVEDEASQEAES